MVFVHRKKRPTLFVVSNFTTLAKALVEHVIANFKVALVTTDTLRWSKWLSTKSYKSVCIAKKPKDLSAQISYVLYLSTFIEERPKSIHSEKRLFYTGLKIATENNSKLIAVFPHTSSPSIYKQSNQILSLVPPSFSEHVGTIFLGEVLREFDSLKPVGLGNKIVFDSTRKKIRLPRRDRQIFLFSAEDAARAVVNKMLSHGVYGEKTSILPSGISTRELYGMLLRLSPNLDFVFVKPPKETRRRAAVETIKSDLRKSLAKVVRNRKIAQVHKIPEQRVMRHSGPLGGILLILVVAMIVPVALVVVAGTALFISTNALQKGNFTNPSVFITMANKLSRKAKKVSSFYSSTPAVGVVYEPVAAVAGVLEEMSQIAGDLVSSSEEARVLLDGTMGKREVDISSNARLIGSRMSRVYERASFLQSEISSNIFLQNFLGKYGITLKEMDSFRSKVLALAHLAEKLPTILGAEKRKTYLVLVQNNLQLRPTGGALETYALLTIDEGVITEIVVSDISSADSQLKGQVEPPSPIAKHLMEENWFLKDSNWSPDFAESATRAAWFIGKELDLSVDGVMAVDLYFLQDLVEIFGPVTIESATINENNLFEKVQSDEILTSLVTQLALKAEDMTKDEQTRFGRALLEASENKNLQVSIPAAEKEFSALGWNGKVLPDPCLGNCLVDWYEFVEANMGRNYANYHVGRDILVSTEIAKSINKTLEVTFTNTADTSLADMVVYKMYARLLVPLSSTNFSAEEIFPGSSRSLPLDVVSAGKWKEIGIYTEINPGEKKSIKFSWTLPNTLKEDRSGEYIQFTRPQAGIESNYSFELKPFGIAPLKMEPFSLTDGGVWRYNAQLARDFVSRISW